MHFSQHWCILCVHLELAVHAHSDQPEKLCFKWAYFGNGPDAAASIAPTLIRHWLCAGRQLIYSQVYWYIWHLHVFTVLVLSCLFGKRWSSNLVIIS